ncbi:MAG: hypothetical protein HRU09_10155 [Oligoflexales bacterium]|nr:hypothetical protein [Oligoflexales bacterium]
MFLISLIPLFLFAIVNYYRGLEAGVWSGVVGSVFLGAFFWLAFDYLDYEAVTMVVLLLVLGIISIRSKKEIYFKLQPVASGIISVAILAWFQIFDQPFFLKILPKMHKVLPPEQLELMGQPEFVGAIERVSLYCIVLITLHTALLAFTAFYSSTRMWLLVKALALPFVGVGIVASELIRNL